ncbi:MAG: hypothetical protein K6A41_06160 [Bacteroidales bacterium]|nr:hypothetical protein [Bacteroidales bacterium]
MSIAIYTLTSELHDPKAVAALTDSFLSSLHITYNLRDDDYSDYGSHDLDLIFVRTGGTEGIFKRLLPQLLEKSRTPFYLLASDKSNSLPASLEILSFLRQQGRQGEILHGNPEHVAARIELLARVGEARRKLQGCRLGVVGEPSDWLIASAVDAETVRQKMGVVLLDIPMATLLKTLESIPEPGIPNTDSVVAAALPGAQRIYQALLSLVEQEQLQGFTLRCFDLLDAVHNTGCWALAKLNKEGYIAGCEGDVPTMLTMMVARTLTGVSGFQCNPASINAETGAILFAHCTVPLDMVEQYELDTHYESGIGVGIRGHLPGGPVTVFKLSSDLSRFFVAEGELIQNHSLPDLCRTQVTVYLDDPQQANYFLTDPIGNHHVVVPGRQAEVIKALFSLFEK